jgi:iron-sulfur cluster assembly accessory protein
MITITPRAAEQIRISAKQGNMIGMPLRIACQKQPDGSFHYALGFDDQSQQGDETYTSEGIDLVVSVLSQPLLIGTIIDYVELESGQFEIIFLNPNDPNYKPAE